MTAKRASKTEAILAAARGVIDDVGYAGFSMRAISARLGMSASTLYFYFRTKEEIFLTLVLRRLHAFHTVAEQICGEPDGFESMYAAFADEYRDYYEHHGRYLNVWALLSDEAVVEALPEPLVAQVRRVLATMFALVHRTLEQVLGQPVDSVAVPFLWMTLTGLAETFCGPRARAHVIEWPTLVAFSARTVAAGLVAPRPYPGGNRS